ncbi:phosphoglycerate mutase family protein [Lysobacter sp. LF1]|uniref:Phosphoglycerate mutase family protein n=1 Tax=Lysobacter stagni TaxID=3045172 RepID=A0ABT6XGW0_9GAMM|nr:phosphoglycerate mutase family protein [Lysobacter sp. LF1]MDI9239303.1 phosphoglycerate mutase family protein [Lysobacter sp. LF1]
MKFAPVLLALALLAGCASMPKDEARTTFILVRHAEKVADGSKDPPLTADGEQRAQALSRRLASTPLSAVYATGFQRTQQTAAPTAHAHKLDVITYDAKLPAPQLAAQLRRDHARGTVLVVGHSNTIPDIATALCGCPAAPMSEAEYDRLTTVRIDAEGHATLDEGRQD